MSSHHLAELYADQLANTIWLELGADRSSQQTSSTSFLQKLANKHNATFISVDICESPDPTVIQSDAVEFCKNYNFENRLGLVYLDNFDWMWSPQKYRDESINHWMSTQITEYRARGTEMHNIASSLTHLAEMQALDNAWANQALVIMDDTWFDHNNDVFCGKGNAAIYHFLGKQWQVLNGAYNETYITMGKNLKHRGNTIFDVDALNKPYGRVWKTL
jgi:hypothetical protein